MNLVAHWIAGQPYQGENDQIAPIYNPGTGEAYAQVSLGGKDVVDQAVEEALDQTQLTAIANQPLHECSSGQLQRCLFARAIVQDAPLLLLDEPFTAMDQSTQANLLAIIEQWRQQGKGQIIVLHDLHAVRALSDHVLLIGDGASCFGPTSELLTTENLVRYGYYSATQAAWLEEGLRS